MNIEIGHIEGDAILGAMQQVALAGDRPLTAADTASMLAAAHYMLRRPDFSDIGSLPLIMPNDLSTLLRDREVADEAVKYPAIMTLVDGVLDNAKLARVLDYSRALDVEADYLTELVEAASGHMSWVVADTTPATAARSWSRPSPPACTRSIRWAVSSCP